MTPIARTLRSVADRSGSVLVEFALVVPILLALLLGMYDLGASMMVRFKVASATQMVADIVSLTSMMQTADITNFFNAAADAMVPFSSPALQLRVSNIYTNGSNGTFVYWSCASTGLTPLNATDTYSATPDGTALSKLLLLSPVTSGNYKENGINTSFIMVESTLTYTAPTGTVFPSAQTIKSIAYAMPRVSTFVGYGNGDPNYAPPLPTTTKSATTTTIGTVSCSKAG